MTKVTIDMGDLTLAQTDEAQKLMEKTGVSETLAFAYVALKADNPDMTMKDVGALKLRDIRLIAYDPTEDADPSSPGE